MSEKETYEICNEVDSFIARELTESIIHKVSYDMLEAHYGILPISRRSFYRRRRTVQRLMRQRMVHLIEEKNGQLRMEFVSSEILKECAIENLAQLPK